MKRIFLLATVCLLVTCSCKNHIEPDDYHSPKMPQEDDKIDMRVIKPSDSTKLQKIQEDSAGRIYK